MQSFEFRNIKLVDKESFSDDLNSTLLPLVAKSLYFSPSKFDFDYHFIQMVNSFF